MRRFSDRIGITQTPTELQLDGMNAALSISLWNWAVELVLNNDPLARLIFSEHVRRPLHDWNVLYSMSLAWLHTHYEQAAWFERYNFIEFILQSLRSNREAALTIMPYTAGDAHQRKLNAILERELSGYRAIDGQIVAITDKHEIQSIREAMSVDLAGPALHISKALTLLGKKPKPDYENSVKESISAVESVCKLLTGEKSGGIDAALKKLSTKTSLHPAFQKALAILHGYTSDESGVRHAFLKSSNNRFRGSEIHAGNLLCVCKLPA